MSARDAAWAAGLALAVIVGAWLRLHGLDAQVLQDDEWHAVHKLMNAGYGEIFRSFGYADHSIPLTLMYKAMASTVGLTETNMRIVQAFAGIALIPLAAATAWFACRGRAATLLCAFLVAGAPFLVLYSRFARPYAITTLLVVVVLWCAWLWREHRAAGLPTAICVLTALSAWLHPISAIFPAVAIAFIFAEDLLAGKTARRRLMHTAVLGVVAGLWIAALLAVPIANDLRSLAAKAGGHHAGGYTLSRMLSLFAGGLPDSVTALATLVAAFGAWRMIRARPTLGAYLAALAVIPVVVLMLLGALWTHQGHTFGRYVFPAQLIFLLWFSVGFVDLVRLAARGSRPWLELGAAALVSAGYLAVNPAIHQVATLGPWYGHAYHHLDYVPMHNEAALQYFAFDAPRFYHRLATLPPGSAPVIEAPFSSGAPGNPMAFYATFHRQPETIGFLHDLCLGGPYEGEVPKDARFRFRDFVFLDDRKAVLATGARYLLLHRDILNGKPFLQADRCLAALTRLYGEPVDLDARLAVFDLRAPAAPRKLQ